MCWLMNGWVLSERGFGGCEDLQDGLVGGMLPRELSYIFLFLIQFLIALSFVVWHEVGRIHGRRGGDRPQHLAEDGRDSSVIRSDDLRCD